MTLPEDPYMLLSLINMKLRDGDYENFEDLCLHLGVDAQQIAEKLKSAGFEYIPSQNQFR